MLAFPVISAGSEDETPSISFKVRTLGSGVHALVASPLAGGNSGLIVGSRAALMIDAGLNGSIARELQRMAALLTDRPLRYIVNTSCRGDHTFGNGAFGPSVSIIAHRSSAAAMADPGHETRACGGGSGRPWAAVDGVLRWRRPDRLFERRIDIDLGGRIVQVWHFGPGHTIGDAIVYEPDTRTAWTGDAIGGEQGVPILLEAAPLQYIETLVRLKSALQIKRIVPSHGPLTRSRALERTIEYLWSLHQDVRLAYDVGMSDEAAVEVIRLRREHRLSWFSSRVQRRLLRHLHRMNVLYAYRELREDRKYG